MQIPKAKRLKAIDKENRQLKQLAADQAIDLEVVMDLLKECCDAR